LDIISRKITSKINPFTGLLAELPEENDGSPEYPEYSNASETPQGTPSNKGTSTKKKAH
jgi:hypothetical protein